MPMPVRDLMRAMNRAKVIEIIRTSGMISRVALSRETGLSKASVTGVTADLIQDGLIIEKKSGEYEGGRRPKLLGLNPNGAYVIGVNLSIFEISVVIVNLAADILASYQLPLASVQHSPDEVVEKIIHSIQACIWQGNLAKEQISGVGIGVPGPVYSSSGIICYLPNYGWENVNLKDAVQRELQHPCYIDNSSNTLAAAESWFGKGKGVDNFLVVTLLNGVGLGMVINGRLYRGAEGIAGEFGHMTVDKNGPLCRCGKKGCVESYAGIISILRDALIAAENGEWSPPDLQNLTYEDVLEGLHSGNEALVDIFTQAGRVLGYGVAQLISVFNPSRVIITGRGVLAGEPLLNPFLEELEANVSDMFGPMKEKVIVQRWTEQDWARAAGTLVLQELYTSPVSQLTDGGS